MKLILSLLKKILVSLSNFYRKDYVNAELDKRVDSTVFTSSLGDETAERKRVDLEISASIDDNEANDEALAKVIEWQGYADQICRSVDDDVAIAFAEEFEKATEKYLDAPMVTEKWDTIKDADGTVTSTNPYYGVQPVLPIIDFNVVSIDSTSLDLTPFNVKINVPVFLPNSTRGVALLRQATLFNSALIFPNMGVCTKLLYGASSFNCPLSLPSATNCQSMLVNTASFNQPLSLPKATNCSYMLSGATSFNSTLELPVATDCSYMLRGASKFNQPLSLPKAKNCLSLLREAKAFNSTLDLPVATTCEGLLYNATSFNQPLNLPNAVNCYVLLRGATSFNQPIILPKATNCDALLYMASIFNQPLNLPNAATCKNMLSYVYGFNQPVNLPACYSANGAFRDARKMSAENISVVLDSLPSDPVGAGGTGVISFVGCSGIASTATTETFTVTDDDGTEYSLENCPIFDTDDENQTLRKAFVLAVVKKGWTIEMSDSAPYKRELAYLQATGTQWIDTGVACIMNTTAEYSVEVDTDSEISINTYELTGYGSGWYFGLIGGSENSRKWTINTSTSGTMETPGVVADTVYTVVQTWQSNTLTTTISDGTDTGTNSRSVSPSSSNQFRLFVLYPASGNPYACKCLRIKSVKYTQDGVLLRDFIPVLDGSGIPCMYDKVSGELFANKGTGTFAYGELDGEAVAETIEL